MTPAKKTAARKPTARAALAPVQLKSRTRQVERVALFSVDDTVYTMPAIVELGDALKLLALLRLQSDEHLKTLFLLRNLCGDEAGAALMDDSTMTKGEWSAIGDILREHAFGQLEEEGEEGKG